MIQKASRHILLLSLSAALLAAGLLKFWLITSGRVPFNADEAVVGLMARHILLGERPTFFYGQAYMGSLDAWLIAVAFKLFGEGVWVIRLVQAFLYLLVLLTTAILGKVAFGSWQIGIISVWLLAFPTVNVSLYTTATLGGYGEALLIGNLILLSAFRIVNLHQQNKKTPFWLWFAFGFLAGLGLWAFGLTIVYSLPAGIWVSWKYFHSLSITGQSSRIRIREIVNSLITPFLAVCLGGMLGSLPWWGYALDNGLAPLVLELRGGNIAGVEGLSLVQSIGQHLFNLALLGGSVIFGFRPPWEVCWLALPLLPFVFAFWLWVLFFAARRGSQPLLLGVMLTLCLGFLLTPFGADPSGRYFLPLAVPLALFAADFILYVRDRFGAPAWSLLALVLVFNLWGTLQSAGRWPPGITTQFNPLTQVDPRSQEELVTFLRDHNIRRGFTNYWVAYPLAFLTSEELIFVPRLPYHADFRYTSRDDRYVPYDRLVEAADRQALITSRHPALDIRLRQLLKQHGGQWKEAQVGDYHIFYDLSVKITPDALGLLNQPVPGQQTQLGIWETP